MGHSTSYVEQDLPLWLFMGGRGDELNPARFFFPTVSILCPYFTAMKNYLPLCTINQKRKRLFRNLILRKQTGYVHILCVRNYKMTDTVS